MTVFLACRKFAAPDQLILLVQLGGICGKIGVYGIRLRLDIVERAFVTVIERPPVTAGGEQKEQEREVPAHQ